MTSHSELPHPDEPRDELPDGGVPEPAAEPAVEPAPQSRFAAGLGAIANSALLAPSIAAITAMDGVALLDKYASVPTVPAILGGIALHAGGRVADWCSTRRTFRASDRAAAHGIQSGIWEEGWTARGAATLAEFDKKSRRPSSLLGEGAVAVAACVTPYISVPFAAASFTAAFNNRRLEKKINRIIDGRAT